MALLPLAAAVGSPAPTEGRPSGVLHAADDRHLLAEQEASRSSERPPPADPAPEPEPEAAPPPPPRPTPVAGLDQQQMDNAAAIVEVGSRMGLPTRAKIIAVAVALQESKLYVLGNTNVPSSYTAFYRQGMGHDHDSVGLFQQRPNPPEGRGSWGPVCDLMDPQISAEKFYRALMRIRGWENLPLTVAAQRVQGSAFPDHYAKHETRARQIVEALGG